MSHRTSTDLLVLHALRCVGFAGLGRLAASTGLSEAEVESELIDLAVDGLVTHLSGDFGDFGGWGLTDAGRAAEAVRISAELDATGTRATVAEAYERFLVLNPELLDICTAWQTGGADPAYAARVLDLLAGFDQRAAQACADVSAALGRFHRYRVRLAGALDQARSGAVHYIADDFESYHTVWFQLHEDFLATLGIPRQALRR